MHTHCCGASDVLILLVWDVFTNIITQNQVIQDVSRSSGVKMNDPASKASIKKFVKAYRGQVDISEIAEDLDSFQNFNEFFYRKLKPGARPIASHADDTVLVSAADCRLMTYETVQESQQFWIKVCPTTQHRIVQSQLPVFFAAGVNADVSMAGTLLSRP